MTQSVAAAPGAQHRFLDRVLGVVEGGQHPVAVHVQLSAVQRGQLVERGLVTVGRGFRQDCTGEVGRHQCAASPALTSCTRKPLPSGSLNDRNEL